MRGLALKWHLLYVSNIIIMVQKASIDHTHEHYKQALNVNAIAHHHCLKLPFLSFWQKCRIPGLPILSNAQATVSMRFLTVNQSLPSLKYCVYKSFTFWPMVTQNDLWPSPKMIGSIYWIWTMHMLVWDPSQLPSLRYCVFKVLPFDLCWLQMTSDLHQKQ